MSLTELLTGKSVFLTGHTGFKGSWLCHILKILGAEVTGFSQPPLEKSHFQSCDTEAIVTHRIGNINNYGVVEAAMLAADPDIVIHMAAQSLVRLSYEQPLETMQTNVIGTANVLASALKCRKKPILACITSDKCYENVETSVPFKETDRMGGHDPYSASKGAAELVASSFAKSFYLPADQSILTLRGGNVIGGGDWSSNRILTDLVEALASQNTPTVRNPGAVRPWQHILDVLHGYLAAIEHVANCPEPRFDQFNIGPGPENVATVSDLATMVCTLWNKESFPINVKNETNLHEAQILRLDVSKALNILAWRSKYDLATSVSKTIDWYKADLSGSSMSAYTSKQIVEYFNGERNIG